MPEVKVDGAKKPYTKIGSKKYALTLYGEAAFVTSHNSWLARSSDNKEVFFLKLQHYDGEVLFHDIENVRQTISANDYIESGLNEARESRIFYAPERFGAGIQSGEDSHAYSIRSAKEILYAEGSIETYPLHGVLASPDIQYFADQYSKNEGGKITIRDWMIQEFALKLGEFAAISQIEHGIWGVFHTQNLLIRVDRSTGKIISFGFRDANDVMMDAIARIEKGRKVISNGENIRWIAQLNQSPVEGAGWETPEATFEYLSDVMNQAANQTDQRASRQISASREMADAFFRAYENKTKLILPAFSKNRLKFSPYNSDMSQALKEEFFQLEGKALNPRVEIQIASRFRFQSFMDTLTKLRLPKIGKNDLLYSQERLQRIFDKKVDETKVHAFSNEVMKNYAKDKSLGRVGYAFDGEKIILYQKSNLKPLAFAYDLSSKESKGITSRKIRCIALKFHSE